MYIEKKKLYLFISTGESKGFFTLREQTSGIEVRGWDKQQATKSYHIKTLSKDYTKALKLAKEFAATSDLELRADDEPPAELREIERRTPEQMQKMREAQEARNREHREKKKAEQQDRINKAMDGFGLDSPLSFGKYRGREEYTLRRIILRDRSYLQYILDQNKPESGSSLPFPEPTSAYQAQVNWIFSNVVFEDKPESEFIGTVDETIGFEGQCIRVEYDSVQVNQFHSVGMYHYTLESKAGNLVQISYSGNKWRMDEGESFSFSAVVKKHSLRRGQKLTELKRLKQIQPA